MEMEVRSKLNPWYFFLNISLINAIFIYNPHSALQAVVFPSTKKISPLTYQKSDLRVGWDNCSLTWIENNTQNQSLMSLNSNY